MLLLVASGLANSAAAGMIEGWDKDQEKWIREVVFVEITHGPNPAPIRAAFEKSLAHDPAAIPELIALLDNPNEDVATTAAKQLGLFTDPRASAALKARVASEPRRYLRASSLLGLGRMRDPDAAALAIQALDDRDDAMKGAGGIALGLIGDNSNVGAILHYLDVRETLGVIDVGAFDILAELGDPPGSTAVRDRLLAEADNKANDFDEVRIEAARALWKMGHAALVQHILDREDAEDTFQRLLSLEGIVKRAALAKGILLNSQSALDLTLSQVSPGKDRSDQWDRPLRLKFVSAVVFHVVSDGPDKTPDTADDMSTAETFEVYDQRIFGDLF